MNEIISSTIAILKGTKTQPKNLMLKGNGVLCKHGNVLCLLTAYHVIDEIFEKNIPVEQEDFLYCLNKECVYKHLTEDGVEKINFFFDEQHLFKDIDLAILRMSPPLALIKYGISISQTLPNDSQGLFIYGFDKDKPIEGGFEPVKCHFIENHQNYSRIEFAQGSIHRGHSGSPICNSKIVGILKKIESTGGATQRLFPIAQIIPSSLILKMMEIPSNGEESNSNLENSKFSSLSERFDAHVPQFKKEFSDRDKDRFVKDSFENIVGVLDSLCKELENTYSFIEHSSERIDSRKSFFTLYYYGKKTVSFTLWFGGVFGSHTICFVYGDTPATSENLINEMIYIKEQDNQLKLKPQGTLNTRQQKNELMLAEEVAEYIWGGICQKFPSVSPQVPSNSLAPKQVAELAQSCIDNFVTPETADLALLKVGIRPAMIANSPNTFTYYVNVIQYLVARRQLENWLTVFAKENLKFAKDWLARPGKDR